MQSVEVNCAAGLLGGCVIDCALGAIVAVWGSGSSSRVFGVPSLPAPLANPKNGPLDESATMPRGRERARSSQAKRVVRS